MRSGWEKLQAMRSRPSQSERWAEREEWWVNSVWTGLWSPLVELSLEITSQWPRVVYNNSNNSSPSNGKSIVYDSLTWLILDSSGLLFFWWTISFSPICVIWVKGQRSENSFLTHLWGSAEGKGDRSRNSLAELKLCLVWLAVVWLRLLGARALLENRFKEPDVIWGGNLPNLCMKTNTPHFLCLLCFSKWSFCIFSRLHPSTVLLQRFR